VYSTDLGIERYKTLDPTWLGIDYANDSMPTSLPPLPVTAQAALSGQPASPRLPTLKRPALASFTPVSSRQLSATQRSLGGASQVAFDEQSATILLGLDRNDASEVARIVDGRRNARAAPAQAGPGTIKLVIDRALVTGTGSRGGYFYALYLNLPALVDSPAARESYFVGTLGAFQIAGASHHGPSRLEYDVSDLLSRQPATDFSRFFLSWVRVDGDNAPVGRTINIDEVRFELSYEMEAVQEPPLAKPRGWYRRR
jgi:tyrosinase